MQCLPKYQSVSMHFVYLSSLYTNTLWDCDIPSKKNTWSDYELFPQHYKWGLRPTWEHNRNAHSVPYIGAVSLSLNG